MMDNFNGSAAALKSALCAAFGLMALAGSTLAMEDHLPPGSQVVYMRQPAYLEDSTGHAGYSNQDIEQATELAKLGDAEAQNNLGVMLASRGDYKGAAGWFKGAAARGVGRAAYNLGALYAAGQGVTQDMDQARHCFETAAGQGDALAEFQLGRMAADAVSEMGWYAKAAQQGLPAAQYNLAVMYHNAEGVDQDDVKAYAWLLVAQRAGVDVADAKPVITDGMTPEQMQSAEKLSRTLYIAPDAYTKQ